MELVIGSEVEGKITGIAPFGAFVDLSEGKVGLVHISQVSDSYVTDISKHLNIGDLVKVKVLGMTKEGKYDLSIKQVGKTQFDSRKKRFPKDRPAPGTFEEKINQFLKQSDEKLLDLKRNIQYKQEGKKRKKKKEE